jgi:large subunit ribosomal protein L10
MPKADKVATVAEITDRFRSSSAAVVTEYRGLTMAQLTELRRSLGKDTAYTVAKNTLVKRAAAEAGVTGLDDMFVGPTAVAFIAGEPVDAAKALRDFAKTHPLLVIKGGLLDGRKIEPAEVAKLADLESREILLGKMAGAMLATLTKAAYVLNALPSQVARLAAALQDKRIADGEVLEAATDEAAVVAEAEAIVEAEVVAEAEAIEEIAVAEVVAEEVVAVELAEEISVIETVAEEAIAEASTEAEAEEILAEAAVEEVVAIQDAADEVAVIEAVAEELAEEVVSSDDSIKDQSDQA